MLLGIYVVFTAYVSYFYMNKRVRVLENNSFHLAMSCLLIVCSFCCIADSILFLIWYSQVKSKPIEDIASFYGPLYRAATVFLLLEWFFDMTIHCWFAIKYWTAS